MAPAGSSRSGGDGASGRGGIILESRWVGEMKGPADFLMAKVKESRWGKKGSFFSHLQHLVLNLGFTIPVHICSLVGPMFFRFAPCSGQPFFTFAGSPKNYIEAPMIGTLKSSPVLLASKSLENPKL